MMSDLSGACGRHEAIRAEIAGFQALIKVLEAEADALRRADADALSILSGAKMERVAALQGLARQRTQEMKRAGLPESAVGVKTWLAQATDPKSSSEAWRQLTHLALEAKRQNEVNGRLAARQRWHFDAALGALLQAAGVSSIYGADGRARRTTVSQAHLAV
jgi:flagellar biosynthesis/type III secretory pathway chaperone